ncbi:unnamed protein product [Rhizoctonia solani]|uniref:tyrosinase n=1 Tax=Rhizoctonia solani TaxID=456999 RepID=A0A8H3HI94_9AGAM|nr:unnamed protein product [Rhizoctonia solani]
MAQSGSDAKPYLITGVVGDTYPRLEIRDLQEKHPEQFTLLVLAWEKIRQPDHQPVASRFVEQGMFLCLEFMDYPTNVGPETLFHRRAHLLTRRIPGKESYCNHESVLFPTWHRPSMLLLEQSLSEAARDLAEDFATQTPAEAAKWKQAAKELRLPFWDWTDPRTGTEGLPKLLYQPTLSLKFPEGKTKEQPNILAYYNFGPTRPDGFVNRRQTPVGTDKVQVAYYANWDRTYKWPQSTPSNPQEQIDELNDRLKGKSDKPLRGSWSELTRQVALLFSFRSQGVDPKFHPNIWDQFSNTGFQSQPDRKQHPELQLPPWVWNSGSLEQPHNTLHLVLGGIGHMMDPDFANFDPIFYLHHCNIDRLLAFWEHIYPDYWMGEKGYTTPDGGNKDFIQPDGKFESETPIVKASTDLTPFRKGDGSYWISNNTRWADQSEKKYYTYPPIVDPANPQNIVELKPVDDAQHPYIFGGSYQVEILYDLGNGETGYVGSVSAFARARDTQCSGCQARRAAGIKSSNVVLIPHDIVVKILNHYPELKPEEALNKALRAQISMPGDIVIGRCSGQAQPGRSCSLPPQAIPKIALHSSNVEALQDSGVDHPVDRTQDLSPLTPYETYDWRAHGDLSLHWYTDN